MDDQCDTMPMESPRSTNYMQVANAGTDAKKSAEYLHVKRELAEIRASLQERLRETLVSRTIDHYEIVVSDLLLRNETYNQQIKNKQVRVVACEAEIRNLQIKNDNLRYESMESGRLVTELRRQVKNLVKANRRKHLTLAPKKVRNGRR